MGIILLFEGLPSRRVMGAWWSPGSSKTLRGGQTISGVFDSHPLRHLYLVLSDGITGLKRGFVSLVNGDFPTLRLLSCHNPLSIRFNSETIS